ncbi:MarR family transcriptional regulator [Actinoplanes sp. NBRC 103695]|uniref:MarR family winged helix-turn-helix transcriptional regulator n=1 Tax=Actinoplanes sp. NBRC 103695 TaxID=3032202 RepID=UPI0024A0B5E7|nr:MarR family transcriptional regulator [Actinoplanes sp. NBRC 103695]GLY94610.1 MarR family transcriptional regulator [Actinoplanes sp. NBRC 103695]
MDEFTDPPPAMSAVRQLVDEAVRLRRTLTRRTGLSETELDTLEHLIDGVSTPSELARRLEVSTAASTGIVDRLERRGHVERRPHPTDRRRLEVHVTAGGRAELLRQLSPGLRSLADLEADLTAPELAVVVRYLEGVRDVFAREATRSPAGGNQDP